MMASAEALGNIIEECYFYLADISGTTAKLSLL